jgi:DNA-binding transcriptional LysR family regulator
VGKKVVLTEAGEALLQHAERALRELVQARETLGRLGKWGHRRLRLGASPTACQYLLPEVLRGFKREYPQSVITLEPCDAERAVELLESRSIDLAVCLEPMFRERLEFIPLFHDEMQFLVGAGHPWAVEGQVDRPSIARQNYLLYAKKSYTWRMIQSYFAEEELVLNAAMELGSVDAIKELVKLELGITILAPWVAAAELRDQTLVAFPLGRRKLRRAWGVAHLQARRLGLVEETFIRLCRNFCERFERGGGAAEPAPVLTGAVHPEPS